MHVIFEAGRERGGGGGRREEGQVNWVHDNTGREMDLFKRQQQRQLRSCCLLHGTTGSTRPVSFNPAISK